MIVVTFNIILVKKLFHVIMLFVENSLFICDSPSYEFAIAKADYTDPLRVA
jgi:hypothetical protein